MDKPQLRVKQLTIFRQEHALKISGGGETR